MKTFKLHKGFSEIPILLTKENYEEATQEDDKTCKSKKNQSTFVMDDYDRGDHAKYCIMLIAAYPHPIKGCDFAAGAL